jgi:hypothetical protein
MRKMVVDDTFVEEEDAPLVDNSEAFFFFLTTRSFDEESSCCCCCCDDDRCRLFALFVLVGERFERFFSGPVSDEVEGEEELIVPALTLLGSVISIIIGTNCIRRYETIVHLHCNNRCLLMLIVIIFLYQFYHATQLRDDNTAERASSPTHTVSVKGFNE